jgi:glycosyltransferase 2 family protein
MRRILFSIIKILISVALLHFALRDANFSGLVSRVGTSSLAWIGLAITATFVQIFIGALRWREIGADCSAPLQIAQAIRFNLIGSFFNQTLPSAIGGDAVRLWLLARGGAGWRAATYSIFVDRALGLIALATIVVASLPWSFGLIKNADGRSALLFVGLVALAAGVGFLVLARLPWPWLKSSWATQHLHACSVVANRLIFSRDHGPKLAALSLLIHLLAAVIAWCVARSIAAPVLLEQALLLVPPVMLITMVPISIAGWGLREASMGLAFGYAGLPTSDGVDVSLLFGAVYFVVGAFGGLVWIASAERAAKNAESVEIPGNGH